MDWQVRFVDYPKAFTMIEADVMPKIRDVLAQGELILRQDVLDFEHQLAEFVGTRYGVAVSNCTDGLRLTLEALGIGPGDEVITVAHTFVATIAAIHHVGATPVLLDVGEDHNLDVQAVEGAITARTRAIIPVHMNGRLCQMDVVSDIAASRGLLIIEDAAQALGASLCGMKGGAWGIAGGFSFYPAKLLGAYGDAGAVVTSDEELASRLRALRDHGRVSRTELNGWGWNCRMDNLQAAVLNAKLKRVPGWIARRRRLASIYDEQLSGLAYVKRPPGPNSDGLFFDVYQNYVIEAESREALLDHLTREGIECLAAWPTPVHHQLIGLSSFNLPRTESLAQRAVSLPLTPELDEGQVSVVANAIRKFYE